LFVRGDRRSGNAGFAVVGEDPRRRGGSRGARARAGERILLVAWEGGGRWWWWKTVFSGRVTRGVREAWEE